MYLELTEDFVRQQYFQKDWLFISGKCKAWLSNFINNWQIIICLEKGGECWFLEMMG